MIDIKELCRTHIKEVQKLERAMKWLVDQEKLSSFDEASQVDKEELAGLLLEALDDKISWFKELKNSEIAIVSLGNFMSNKTAQERDYFLSILKANVIKYWGVYLNYWITSYYKQNQRLLMISNNEGI